jgi:hypothetical protein
MADGEETTQVWPVERTCSDDEQNLIILTYATPDGEQYRRKERALTSFTGPARDTYAGLNVLPGKLADVTDADTRERYAAESATRFTLSDRLS